MQNGEKKFGINRKLLTALLISMSLMIVAVLGVSGIALRNNYYKLYTEKAQDVVRMLADEIDGDWIREFGESYQKDDTYEETKRQFDLFKTNFNGIQYLYVFKPQENGFVYLIEGCRPGDDMSFIAEAGDEYTYVDTDYENIVPDIQAKKASDRIILGPDVGYGRTISAWAPVMDSNGDLVAMVCADYILENISADINSHVMRIFAIQLLFICLTVLVMLVATRRIVVQPISDLTQVVDSYEHGVLVEDMSRFKSNDEISWLAFSFKDMTVRMDQYIRDLTAVTAEKERIGAELNVATQIQADMLPRIFPAFPGRNEFDLFATMTPAKEVGGDFYDFFMIDDDRLGIVVADVSGKGVPAALFMVIAKTLIKNRALTGNFEGPGEVLRDANNQLCEGNDAELFVTVWFGILTISTGHVVFSSAGHEYPAFCRIEEGFRLEKDKHGMPLATMENLKFRENETVLKPGETLYLYTDGVTEATNADNELFGEDRMIESLRKHSDEDMETLLKSVRKDIDEFVGSAPQFDDITMLAVHYNGVTTSK